MKKKIMTTIAAIAVLSTVFATSVSAGSISQTYSGDFSKEWMKHYTSADDRSGFGYGFNNFMIDEDIVNGCHFDYKNRGFIEHNDDGDIHYAAYKSPGISSNYQITHKGPKVEYGIKW